MRISSNTDGKSVSKSGFAKLYLSVLESAKLDSTQKLVLSMLIDLSTMYDVISPRYEDISKWLCIGLMTAKRAISKLVELGYVTIKSTPRNNIYILNKEKLNADFGIYPSEDEENEEKNTQSKKNFSKLKKKGDTRTSKDDERGEQLAQDYNNNVKRNLRR